MADTLPLVMVVFGGPMGLWPSPIPRMLSGKMWHSVACSRLSARFTAVQPTNLPAPRSATLPLALTMMLGLSGKVSFTSPLWSEWITKPEPPALVTVPLKRIRPAKGLAGAEAAGAWASAAPVPARQSSRADAIRGLRDMVVLLGVYLQTDARGKSLHRGPPDLGGQPPPGRGVRSGLRAGPGSCGIGRCPGAG